MKRIANYLIALAVAAFTFTSCADVPSPFGDIVKPASGDVVVIEPSGTGTEADPYNVAGVLEYISGLGADTPSPKEVYIKGYAVELTDISASYGNATFTMSDNADGTANKFTVYRAAGLGNQKVTDESFIKQGDMVVVCGKVTNYKGNTPETVQGAAYVYSVNGNKGGGTTPATTLGTKDAPLTVAQALETINALADGGETADAYVKGTISQVTSYNSTYKSITYYISDDGKTTNELQVYSGKGLNGAEFAAKEDLSVGDQVVIKGKLKKYVKNGNVTPEINQSSEIVTITKASGGGNTGGGEIKAAFGDLDCSNIAAIKLSDGTTLSVSQEDGKSAPIYHENTKIIRIYARNAITINAGSKKIAKVVLDYDTYNGTAYKGNDEMYGEAGSNKITPTKDSASVTFSNVNNSSLKVVNWLESGNSGGTQFRITGITITYAN